MSRSRWRRTLAANAAANLLRNLWAYVVIFCGHFPDGAEKFTADVLENETKANWYLRQMLGAANFKAGPLLAFASGNLCYQIEHHLFPDLPSNRLPQIAVRVREVCDKYDLPYTTGSLVRQYLQVLRTIHKLALPDRFLPHLTTHPKPLRTKVLARRIDHRDGADTTPPLSLPTREDAGGMTAVARTAGQRCCPAPVRLDVAIHEQLLAAVDGRRGVDAADRLCEACVTLFEVDAAAISLVFDGANTGTLGSSDEHARTCDELQFLLGEGPCLDSVTSRAPVLVVDLADPDDARWPVYGPAMLDLQVRGVFAMPVVVAGEYVGALDLFRTQPGRLEE